MEEYRFCSNKCTAIDKNQECFYVKASRIAKDDFREPWKKSEEIAQARIDARNNVCRKINKIDPDYPGKNEL